MRAVISRTLNGAWVRLINRENNSTLPVRDFSYQFDVYKHDGDTMHGAHEMLYDILEFMGWSGDRHDRERIQVRIVHGDKFEHSDIDPKKDCLICMREKA